MEKKNLKQQDITGDFIRSVGCNLVILPCTIIAVGFLVMSGLTLFQWYFFGVPGAWVEPYQDPSYLIALAIILFTLFVYLKAIRRHLLGLYALVVRYRSMRLEKVRIERLIKSDVVQDNQNAALLQYTEAETYEEIASGKR